MNWSNSLVSFCEYLTECLIVSVTQWQLEEHLLEFKIATLINLNREDWHFWSASREVPERTRHAKQPRQGECIVGFHHVTM